MPARSAMSFTRTPVAPRSKSTRLPAFANCLRRSAGFLGRIAVSFCYQIRETTERCRMTRMMLAAALAAALLAAGCGTDETNTNDGSKKARVVAKGKVGGDLTISQWPLYIDPGKRGTVAEFEKASGVDVKYVEEINDNVEFFGKIRPLFQQGDAGGRSLIVVSDWLAARMYKL